MNPFVRQIICIIFSCMSMIISLSQDFAQIFAFKRTRNTSGISLWTYIIFFITQIFWFIWTYFFYIGQMMQGCDASVPRLMHQWGLIPTLFMDTACLLFIGIILFVKVRHVKLAKRNGVNELELAKLLLKVDDDKYLNYGKTSFLHRYFMPTLVIIVVILISILYTFIIVKFSTPDPVGLDNMPKWLKPTVMTFNAIGAITWEAINWPQFIKSIKEKDTTGISLAWAIIMPTSCIFLFVSDLFKSFAGEGFDLGIIFSLIFNGIICSTGVLVLKIINIRNAKANGMTEQEYTKNILLPLIAQKKLEKQNKKHVS